MLYVERAKDGEIIALHNNPDQGNSEEKPIVDEEVFNFLSKSTNSESWKQVLSLTDSGTIRILEDLIDLLSRKNIVSFTELPEQAQERILGRKRLREKMAFPNLLVDNIL
jgi:predicted RNA-binding protein with PUA domain